MRLSTVVRLSKRNDTRNDTSREKLQLVFRHMVLDRTCRSDGAVPRTGSPRYQGFQCPGTRRCRGEFEVRDMVKPLVFLCRNLALLAICHLFSRQETVEERATVHRQCGRLGPCYNRLIASVWVFTIPVRVSLTFFELSRFTSRSELA